MEVGSKLPFLDAYFPKDHHLVGVLAGPISGEIFLGLLHHIGGSSVTTENTDPRSKENSTWTKMINHKSTWSTLMAFPAWFLFASVLLFLNKDCQSDFSVRCISSAIKTEGTLDAEQCRAAAARYLAYSTCPLSEAHSDGLVQSLIRMSESWTLKQFCSHKNKVTSGRFKSFRRPRLISDRKDNMDCKENNGLALRLWLKGFQDCHMKYLTDITKSYTFKGARPKNNYIRQQGLFFRRIPLGIFTECTNLDEEGCELLLHYAALGEILQSLETEEIQELNWTEDAAFAGARVVFDLCELVDSISSSIFGTGEGGFRFVSQLKRKAVGFMVKCIRKLNGLTVSTDGGKKSTVIDFHSRLEEWCYQEGELIQGLGPLNDALSALNVRSLPYLNSDTIDKAFCFSQMNITSL